MGDGVMTGIQFIPRLCFTFLFLTICCLIASQVLAQDEKEPGYFRLVKDPWEFEAEGQVRLRGDYAKNQELTGFAFTPGEKEAQILERNRLGGSIENKKLGFEASAQVQWYGRWGGKKKQSEVDLYQGYIEWEKILESPVSLKMGRQEYSYGSAFFIGTNDFYNGLSWDGFKGSVDLGKNLSIDLVGARMAKLNSGDPSIYLSGLYSIYKIREEGSIEGYLFYNKGGFPFFHREFELESFGQKWFTLGSRVAGKVSRLDYELEPQYQWGRVKEAVGTGRDRVKAYGGHVDVGYTFGLPWKPRLYGAYAFGSGDNDPFDGKYKEFHGTVFNDTHLVGDMNVIADLSGMTIEETHASGVNVWVMGISVTPLSDLGISLDAHRFRVDKVPSDFSKEIGWEVDLVASCKIKKRIPFAKEASLLAGLNRFFTGRFFEQTSRSKKNIGYGYLQAQMEF